MSETAAHLVDCVLPQKPIRQWVMSFPFQLRLCLSVRPKIMARALEITHSCITKYYRKKAGLSKSRSKTGAVTLIQRFGGSLNLNVHFHQLYIDGCYELGEDGSPISYRLASAPTIKELDTVLTEIIKRLTRYLERQQIIVKDGEPSFQLEIPEEDTFSRLQASSVTYRFATGPAKGKKALVLKSMPDSDHNSRAGLVAKQSGFSLHAGVAAGIGERQKLERICRYIARPAVAESRLTVDARGDVIYKLKKTWDDGTTAIKLTPMQLMERLSALVPRPRVHLTRFHGVLGPHYKFRKMIVPKPARNPLTPELSAEAAISQDAGSQTSLNKRISWARLLKRVFNIDITVCPKCAGKTRIIAAIEEPKVVKKILNHLGLQTSAPPLLPARGPPEPDALDIFGYSQESLQNSDLR